MKISQAGRLSLRCGAWRCKGSSSDRRLQQAFTLIEVMIVVAIVAILASIALPSYDEYIKRGHIVAGITPLADMGAKMEQFYQDNRTYAGACESRLAAKPGDTARFKYSCDEGTSSFTAKTEGLGAMSGFGFTLNEKGERSTSSTPSGWTKGSGCWSTRKSGGC